MSADAHDAPENDPRPDGLRSAESLVLVNTGNGKGKSSSAFGMMVRSVAQDWPTAVVQFVKSGTWQVGEEKVGRQLGVAWWTVGEGFSWESEDLSQDQAVAQAGWAHAKSLLESGEYRTLILDEITYPMNWGWISTADVVEAIKNRSPKVNVILTGRDAPQELIDVADTVSEVNNIKHAYEQGIRAKKGIDY
jgi:cob(I)alamin adenosyltransferase